MMRLGSSVSLKMSGMCIHYQSLTFIRPRFNRTGCIHHILIRPVVNGDNTEQALSAFLMALGVVDSYKGETMQRTLNQGLLIHWIILRSIKPGGYTFLIMEVLIPLRENESSTLKGCSETHLPMIFLRSSLS